MSVKAIVLCLKGTTVLGFMLLLQFSYAQFDSTAVERFLEKNKDVISKDFAMIIAKDGKNLFVKNSNEDFKVNTQVPIANATKWLTCAMIMALVDEGKINLDDKVSRYLPIYEKYRKSYITIRHCLTHQTGLEQHQFKPYGHKIFENLEVEAEQFASKSEIIDNPGEYFSFGSAGLTIAARICEVVTKKPFTTLMNDKIFKPLQIRTTNYGDGLRSPNPSGGALSTVQDYSVFLNMLLNKGMHKGKRVLSENAIKQMHTLQMDVNKVKFTPEWTKGFGYGYGVLLLETNEKGEATALTSPGFFCQWNVIDLCRGYSCVLFVKSLTSEKRKNFTLDIKNLLDEMFPSTCK
ncbi:MAG: serine hydrolase domain-containing protein [Chitinophagaceae bacterium]